MTSLRKCPVNHPWKGSNNMWMWHLRTCFFWGNTVVVLRWHLDLMTLEVFSHLSDSVIPRFWAGRVYQDPQDEIPEGNKAAEGVCEQGETHLGAEQRWKNRMWQNQDNSFGIARLLLLGAEVLHWWTLEVLSENWEGNIRGFCVELDKCACISVEVQTAPDWGWCGPNGKRTFLFQTEK